MGKQNSKAKIKTKELSDQEKQLVIYNDNHHSFDYVIDTLMSVCEYELEQAEQCAFLTHYRGQCTIKSGKKVDLLNYMEGLIIKGLYVEII